MVFGDTGVVPVVACSHSDLVRLPGEWNYQPSHRYPHFRN